MDPVVTAAAIGVAGTVVVGVVGFWSTKRASDKAGQVATDNAARFLDAAHDARIWDRRAWAYEQGIAALLYRRQRRREERDQLHEPSRLHAHAWAVESVVTLPDEPYFDRYPPRGWFEVEGALLAYATPRVVEALDAARQADGEARSALDRCRELRPVRVEEVGPDTSGEDSGGAREAPKLDADAAAKLQAALEVLEPALRRAEQKDNDLINAIRDDLDKRPSQARPASKVS